MHDVAIIGAGPAGATLARLAGTKMKILLADGRPLDREYEHGMRMKCCGGLLAPDAQKVLGDNGTRPARRACWLILKSSSSGQ